MADDDALLAMKLHQELNPNTRRVSRRAADKPNKKQALQDFTRKVQGTATGLSTASEDQTQNHSGPDSSQGLKDRDLHKRIPPGFAKAIPQQSEAGSDPPHKQTGDLSLSPCATLGHCDLQIAPFQDHLMGLSVLSHVFDCWNEGGQDAHIVTFHRSHIRPYTSAAACAFGTAGWHCK